MRTIICNTGYGNGPLLRTLEVARHLRSCQIVLPILYERQREILSSSPESTGKIIIDEKLGDIIRSVSLETGSYQDFLERWLENHGPASREASTYIAQTYGKDCIEIARNPLLELATTKKYCMSFGRVSGILERSMERSDVALDPTVAKRAIAQFRAYENTYTRHIFTLPSTLDPNPTDAAVPMTMAMPQAPSEERQSGVYVTVSGIPHTEHLLAFTKHLGLPVFCNDPKRLRGSTHADPSFVACSGIHAHVARAGWGSIWLSLLAGVPLLMPPHDPKDDPEIALNIERVEGLGIGMVYREQEPKDLLRALSDLRPKMAKVKEGLRRKFGTLDGAIMAAGIIAKDL